MTLTPADLTRHASLGIDAALLARAGVRRVDDLEAREVLGLNGAAGDFGGLEYPYIDPCSGYRVTSRVRRDHPPLKADGTPDGKYCAAWGDRRHLYFGPSATPRLSDPRVPAVIVESEKATLALTAAAERAGRPVLVIGTGGCWGWRGRIGKADDPNGVRVDVRGALPDFGLVAWSGRRVVILFDARPNESVRAARQKLACELARRGAEVYHGALPDDDPRVNGPDDLIGVHGDPALWRILDAAAADVLVLNPQAPLPTARAFVELTHTTADGVVALQHQGGKFYAFQRSAYAESDDAAIRAALYRFLDGAKQRADDGTVQPFSPTKTKIENVLDALRAETNLPTSASAPCWLEASALDPFDMVALRNGLLHIPSRQVQSATPSFFGLNQLGFDYDPDAPNPEEWLAFLDALWPDDPESRNTLQEFVGYLLTPRTLFQKIGMIVGPKRSGKGTIARTVRRLLGEANVCGPTLANMGEPFGLQTLIGKTAAIISDARISGHTDTAVVAERLLSISGEDSLSIPRKFLPDWTGQLRTRFLLLTNELPRIEDASGALSSRFLVFALNESFYGREDHHLSERFVPELPGILNWALDGYARLYARGRFVQPTASAALIQEFEDLGSPVNAFVRDRCDVGRGFEVLQPAVFDAWKTWCAANGREKPGTVQVLGRNLRAAVPWLQATKPRVLGGRVRYWQGLRLKQDTDDAD